MAFSWPVLYTILFMVEGRGLNIHLCIHLSESGMHFLLNIQFKKISLPLCIIPLNNTKNEWIEMSIWEFHLPIRPRSDCPMSLISLYSCSISIWCSSSSTLYPLGEKTQTHSHKWSHTKQICANAKTKLCTDKKMTNGYICALQVCQGIICGDQHYWLPAR